VEDLIDNPHQAFSVDHGGIVDALWNLTERMMMRAEKDAGAGWGIVLDRRIGKSGEHTNVATVWPGFAHFNVQTDGLLDRALELGMNAKRDEDSSQLKIAGLSRAVISRNSEFFKDVLDEAKRESTERQEN
jgi:hypothetical protein